MGKYRRVNVSTGRPLEPLAHYSRALRCGGIVLQSGTTAIDPDSNNVAPVDQYTQTRVCFDIIVAAMEEAGVPLADMVYTKTCVTDMAKSSEQREAKLEALGDDIRPTGTLLGIPALIGPETAIEIEAEAILGAASARKNSYTANQC